MENISRREFIKLGLGFSLAPITSAFALDPRTRVHIYLPEKPFQYYIKRGKEKGGRILIVGGIHGNEIGAYKAPDILIDTEVKKGELIIVPRSNFTSILAKKRGYNGDMNRKFKNISSKDPDYKFVESLKQLILTYRPDVVLSLHDGYGFHRLNPKHWGQCIVIDEYKYKGFELYKIAKFVAENANKKLPSKLNVPVYNTQTFSSTRHLEQRKALTGWCLRNNIPAFCIESSKQLTVKEKLLSHFTMLEEFFKIYGVDISPKFDYLLHNIDNYINRKTGYEVKAKINGRTVAIKRYETLKLKKGSTFKIISVNGNRGTFPVASGVNLNWKDFYISKSLSIYLQDDYKKLFNFNIKVV